MASYTNLASLEGLQSGDTIIYSGTTDIAIDFAGAYVQIELIGRTHMNNWVSNIKNGGNAVFNLDTSKLDRRTLLWSYLGGCSLCYSDTYDRFYRIAVAGDCGLCGRTTTASPTSGGGLIASPTTVQTSATATSNYEAQGGTQTAGGKSVICGSNNNVTVTITSEAGFGTPATYTTNKSSYVRTLAGSAGWYNGGMIIYKANSTTSASLQNTLSGAGSGFILGIDGSSYPSGYLGDDVELINKIKNSIDTRSLNTAVYTQPDIRVGILGLTSGNIIQWGIMRVTILDAPISTFKYYNGTSFVDVEAKYYNGTEFVPCNAYRYDGTEFVKLGG